MCCAFVPQGLVDASNARLVNLAAQWEKKRQPLLDQYEELKRLAQTQMVSPRYLFRSIILSLVKYISLKAKSN
jgi:hypothetical protein